MVSVRRGSWIDRRRGVKGAKAPFDEARANEADVERVTRRAMKTSTTRRAMKTRTRTTTTTRSRPEIERRRTCCHCETALHTLVRRLRARRSCATPRVGELARDRRRGREARDESGAKRAAVQIRLGRRPHGWTQKGVFIKMVELACLAAERLGAQRDEGEDASFTSAEYYRAADDGAAAKKRRRSSTGGGAEPAALGGVRAHRRRRRGLRRPRGELGGAGRLGSHSRASRRVRRRRRRESSTRQDSCADGGRVRRGVEARGARAAA